MPQKCAGQLERMGLACMLYGTSRCWYGIPTIVPNSFHFTEHSLINQSHFVRVIKSIFGNDFIVNARKDSRVINPETGHYFELDIWIPKHNLAFEFQVPY